MLKTAVGQQYAGKVLKMQSTTVLHQHLQGYTLGKGPSEGMLALQHGAHRVEKSQTLEQ